MLISAPRILADALVDPHLVLATNLPRAVSAVVPFHALHELSKRSEEEPFFRPDRLQNDPLPREPIHCFLKHRPIDLAKTNPHTIRCTSDSVQFGGLRVVVRDLPCTGELDLPDGTNHYWLSFRPVEAPQRMEIEFKDTHERCLADRSFRFFSPGVRHTSEWRGGEGVAAQFHFQPEFLQRVAASAHVCHKVLEQRIWREVALEQPLEELCRLLMREVETGCRRGTGYFEALSRALAFALVQRLACTQPARQDPRIEHAVRLLEQRCREKVSIAEVARAAGLSRRQFFREFRAARGVSPHAFLVQCRLSHARRLLAVSADRLSLADVAAEAGFSDQTHLTRHFRRAFGQTPGRWSRATNNRKIVHERPIRASRARTKVLSV